MVIERICLTRPFLFAAGGWDEVGSLFCTGSELTRSSYDSSRRGNSGVSNSCCSGARPVEALVVEDLVEKIPEDNPESTLPEECSDSTGDSTKLSETWPRGNGSAELYDY